jgi:hypothetical protein
MPKQMALDENNDNPWVPKTPTLFIYDILLLFIIIFEK